MRRLSVIIALSLVVAAAYGLADAAAWRSTSFTAAGVGAISAPYLLLAFLAGWAIAAGRARLWLAAASGLAVTFVALGAFYGWEAHHLAISTYGARHGLIRYGAGGVVTGPVFGALGALWSRRRSWWAAAAVSLAFLLEPAAWRSYEGIQIIPPHVRDGEYVVGIAVLALGVVASIRRAGHD